MITDSQGLLSRRLRGIAALVLVFAWLLAPLFHRAGTSCESDCDTHAHDASRCAACQIALTGTADFAPSTPVLSLPVERSTSSVSTPVVALLVATPDVRAHPACGPPSV
jgi:hypothetical protein